MRDALPAPDHAAPLKRARVIGVGSPFGDDRAGWLVVDALRREHRARRSACAAARGWTLELLVQDRPGVLLADAIRGCALAIVVDALADPRHAGTASVVDPEQLHDAGAPVSSHGLGVAAAIGLARALGAAPAELVLVAVHVAGDTGGPGGAAAPQNAPAATTAAAVTRAAALVRARLAQAGCVSARAAPRVPRP